MALCGAANAKSTDAEALKPILVIVKAPRYCGRYSVEILKKVKSFSMIVLL